MSAPSREEQIRYYRSETLRIISRIEAEAGEAFRSAYPNFESEFLGKAHTNSYEGLRRKHYEACRLADKFFGI